MEQIDWKVYKYKIESCSVDIGEDEPIKIEPGMIQSFYIEKNYDNDYLPIFILNTLMGAYIYQKITNAKDYATITLTINLLIDRGDNNYENAGTYLSDAFTILPTENNPFIDKKTYDNMVSGSTYGEGTVAMTDMTNSYSFILARKADLASTKNIVNNVITKGTMLTAATYAMQQSGCSNVLMTNPDNGTMYDELLLLPVPLINQLKYLNSYYGFYKEGAQIFFDFDRTYFIRKNAACTAYDDTEIKDVTIFAYDNSNGNEYGKGSHIDDLSRMGYINSGIDQFKVNDLSTTSAQYLGNNSTIINNSGDVSTTSKNTTEGDATTFNIITTSSHNNYITDERQLRLTELKCVVSVTTSNCDLRILTPNRCYHVLTTDSKAAEQVAGNFRLVSMQIMFIRDGGAYTNMVEITLKKSEPS